MRLTNTQIRAIKSNIVERHNKIAKEKNEKHNEQVLKEYYKTKEGKIYKQFIDTFGISCVLRTNIKNFPELNPIKTLNTWNTDLENTIILKTIDCDNLEELISSIEKDLKL